jgi:CO dehydrogenase maturation factor
VTTLIAVAGKGGVGKTTFAALLVRALVKAGVRPVLAVDADPNANLHLLLGFSLPKALGSLREDLLAAEIGGASKGEILEAMVQQRVAEGDDVDLVTMGRGEGPGCYCYVNSLLRQSLSRLAGSYRAVVVDNEAGMEHLSRRNLRRIDHLILVADPSPRGMGAARTIRDLSVQLEIPVGKTWLVRNRPFEREGRTGTPVEEIPFLGEIPHDPSLPEWESTGRSFLEIPAASPAGIAVDNAAREMLRGEKR